MMREYVVVPQAMLKQAKMLSAWVANAFDYAASLPPKAAKKPALARPPVMWSSMAMKDGIEHPFRGFKKMIPPLVPDLFPP